MNMDNSKMKKDENECYNKLFEKISSIENRIKAIKENLSVLKNIFNDPLLLLLQAFDNCLFSTVFVFPEFLSSIVSPIHNIGDKFDVRICCSFFWIISSDSPSMYRRSE